MNVSINILFVAHPQSNMPELLGRKFFRQFFQQARYQFSNKALATGRGGGITLSVEWATPGEEFQGSIPAVAAHFLLVGSVSE